MISKIQKRIAKNKEMLINLLERLDYDNFKKVPLTNICKLEGIHPNFVQGCIDLNYIERCGIGPGTSYKAKLSIKNMEPIHVTRLMDYCSKKISNISKKPKKVITELSPEANQAIKVLKTEGYKITLVKLVTVEKTMTF